MPRGVEIQMSTFSSCPRNDSHGVMFSGFFFLGGSSRGPPAARNADKACRVPARQNHGRQGVLYKREPDVDQLDLSYFLFRLRLKIRRIPGKFWANKNRQKLAPFGTK